MSFVNIISFSVLCFSNLIHVASWSPPNMLILVRSNSCKLHFYTLMVQPNRTSYYTESYESHVWYVFHFLCWKTVCYVKTYFILVLWGSFHPCLSSHSFSSVNVLSLLPVPYLLHLSIMLLVFPLVSFILVEIPFPLVQFHSLHKAEPLKSLFLSSLVFAELNVMIDGFISCWTRN